MAERAATTRRQMSTQRTPRVIGDRRLQAVLLVARGRAVPEVARLTDLKPWAIYAWVRRYLAHHRADALADRPRSGRPPPV